MEIEHPDEGEAGYLKQSDYLNKPKKPSSLKPVEKPVENTIEPVEAVEGVGVLVKKKKRVMSEKQKAALAKAREVSAKKRKEKKALEGTTTTQKPVTKSVKAKKQVEFLPAIAEQSESDSSSEQRSKVLKIACTQD